MFVSASLGVLIRNEKLFYSVLFSQLVLGLGLGLLGMYFCLKINYKFWRRYSFLIFLGSILLTASVFIPYLGWTHGGAQRWIKLGNFSFQPVEILKFGFIIYFAAWLSWVKNKVQDFRFGILPFGIMLAIIATILLKQPDIKSFILITVTGTSMLFISGVPVKYILGVGMGALLVLGSLVFFTPYLPERQGDSIFAVIGEEFGFIGTSVTIFLFLLFALRGFRIANNSPNLFSRLLVSGIVILITAQSFMHIASITGVFPLTGVPLPFMSHGGTSLMIYLIATGIILNVSKFQKHESR